LPECGIGVDGAEALADAKPSDVIVELDLSHSYLDLSIS